MSTTVFRLGVFFFIAATLGLCRMIPFPRYNHYGEDSGPGSSSSNILISSQQDPDSNSNPPPRIQYHSSEQEEPPNSESDSSTTDIFISRISNNNNQAYVPLDDERNDYNPSHSTPSLELIHARRALKKIKDLLGPETLRALLKDEIQAGNNEWHSILSSSSYPFNNDDPNPNAQETNLKLSEVHLLATQPCNNKTNFTSANFLSWFINSAFTPNSPNLWAGHPEHYGVNLRPNPDGTLRGEILEPWGPLMTDTYVPKFMPLSGGPPGSPTGKRKPWMKEHKSYPLQMVGDETLMDGSEKIIANLHYVYRDVEADEGCEGGSDKRVKGKGKGKGRGSGVEAILAMWMPSSTPDEVVQGLAEHLEVEYYNWFRWAYEDIKSGVFKPTS